MDTRFSVAVHSLILIAKSDIPLTSEQIAASAGVNPSYVRKSRNHICSQRNPRFSDEFGCGYVIASSNLPRGL